MEEQVRIQFTVRRSTLEAIKQEAMKAGHYTDAGAARYAVEKYAEILLGRDSKQKG